MKEQVATYVQQRKIIGQRPNDIQQKASSADPDILLQAWAFYLEHGHLPSYISFELWLERLSWWKKSARPIDKKLRSFFIQQLHDEQRLKHCIRQTMASDGAHSSLITYHSSFVFNKSPVDLSYLSL